MEIMCLLSIYVENISLEGCLHIGIVTIIEIRPPNFTAYLDSFRILPSDTKREVK